VQPSAAHRFLKGFWNLRQKLFKDIGGKLRLAYGIELSYIQILRYISEYDFTPSQLAEEMQIPAHGISRALEALEAQQLLERSLDPHDGRKRKLTITKKGQTILQKSNAIIEKEVNKILAVLPKKDLDSFLNHLEKLSKE
jgi:DNA-binding MarR family transcriptional regulator